MLKDLCTIYHVCDQIDRPASDMFKLVILTGEQLKWVRLMCSETIDWKRRSWAVEYRMDHTGAVPLRQIKLPVAAFEIIEARRSRSGFLFPSPRNPNAPVNVSSEFMRELRERSGVKGAWGARDVHAAAQRLIDDPRTFAGDLKKWVTAFIDTYEETYDIGDRGVVL